MNCIFCDRENDAKSIEHIVSESFGNKLYVMKKGEVCDECNLRFSKFEATALSNSVFVMERARFGIVTKKGRTAKGKVDDLTIEGDDDFRKNYLNVTGLNIDNFKDFDPNTNTGTLYIKTFDKSEVATSKLLLKVGLESIFKSQKTIFRKYDFKELKDYLLTKNNNDFPFLTTDFELKKFKSVPICTDKYLLKKNHCELKFLELNSETLLFKFKYGAVAMTINLINRNLEWIKEVKKSSTMANLYPMHYEKKLTKNNE